MAKIKYLLIFILQEVYKTLVLELAALRSKNERLEERLKKVEMKLGITVEA